LNKEPNRELPDGFHINQRITSTIFGPAKGTVVGPGPEKEMVNVQFDEFDGVPTLHVRELIPIPFKVGETVYAMPKLSDYNIVPFAARGKVIGPEFEGSYQVMFEGQSTRTPLRIEPEMISRTKPELPGGFKVGETVYANFKQGTVEGIGSSHGWMLKVKIQHRSKNIHVSDIQRNRPEFLLPDGINKREIVRVLTNKQMGRVVGPASENEVMVVFKVAPRVWGPPMRISLQDIFDARPQVGDTVVLLKDHKKFKKDDHCQVEKVHPDDRCYSYTISDGNGVSQVSNITKICKA
jgi:hypothetical protein